MRQFKNIYDRQAERKKLRKWIEKEGNYGTEYFKKCVRENQTAR